MPTYYFDTHDDDIDYVDDVGETLPDLASAVSLAATTMAEVARDHLPAAGMQKTFTIHVRDEAGRLVLKVTLSFAAEVVDPPVEEKQSAS